MSFDRYQSLQQELGTVCHQKRRHQSVFDHSRRLKTNLFFRLFPIDDCKVTEVLGIFVTCNSMYILCWMFKLLQYVIVSCNDDTFIVVFRRCLY